MRPAFMLQLFRVHHLTSRRCLYRWKLKRKLQFCSKPLYKCSLWMFWLVIDCNFEKGGSLFSSFQLFCIECLKRQCLQWATLKGSILSFHWNPNLCNQLVETNLCKKVFFVFSHFKAVYSYFNLRCRIKASSIQYKTEGEYGFLMNNYQQN